MKIFLCVVLVAAACSCVKGQSNLIQAGGSGCSSEETSEEADEVLEECSAEVDAMIVQGLDKIMEQGTAVGMDRLRKRRDLGVTAGEKRVTGCLLGCIFRKYGVLARDGLPTEAGLVSVIMDGVSDNDFFLAARREVHFCFSRIENFRHSLRHIKPSGGEICDMSYEVFDCITDRLQDFCDSKEKEAYPSNFKH